MDADTTILDPKADVEGTLKGSHARIQGRFRGDVQLAGRLQIEEGARVQAQVRADVVEIAGEFQGELDARSLVLLEKARVSGTVRTGALAVREGALLNGAVEAGAREASRPAPPVRPATPAAAPAPGAQAAAAAPAAPATPASTGSPTAAGPGAGAPPSQPQPPGAKSG